jgi:ubiquinone/menaquinone biosynthesis C-methylase UbiE
MLDVAKTGKIKAECYEQNAENIDFSDNTFDMVTTTFALHEKSIESARLILNEMIRLTKINGDLIIVDFSINYKTAYLYKKGINFLESMAGEEHYDNYKDYNKVGGLDYLLDGLRLKEIEHHNFTLNGVVLKVFRKTE